MTTDSPDPDRAEREAKWVKRWCCVDCGGYGGDYMVRHEVWLAAWPDYEEVRAKLAPELRARVERLDQNAVRRAPDGETPKSHGRGYLLLCCDCLEKRLGRELTIADFDLRIPVNTGIAFGFRLGKKTVV